MKIFTFFIIKQFGVHSITYNMIEDNAAMHTIGKISEESHIKSFMIQNHANFGNLMIL